jgi:hypothetical protein
MSVREESRKVIKTPRFLVQNLCSKNLEFCTSIICRAAASAIRLLGRDFSARSGVSASR